VRRSRRRSCIHIILCVILYIIRLRYVCVCVCVIMWSPVDTDKSPINIYIYNNI